MSDGTTGTEALRKLAKHAPPEAFEQQYEQLLRDHPFRSELIGSENPYTGREITSEADYRAFLREVAYSALLHRAHLQADADRKADRQLERREKEARQAAEAAELRLQEADKRSSAFRAERDKALRSKKDARIGWAVLAAAILLFAAVFIPRLERTAFQKGFSAAQTEAGAVNSAARTDAYSDAGKNTDKSRTPESDHTQTAAEGSEATQTATAATDRADTITYIGNLKSHVFHRSECKNLPSEKNQIIFDSREQAVDYGYTPCGNCDP